MTGLPFCAGPCLDGRTRVPFDENAALRLNSLPPGGIVGRVARINGLEVEAGGLTAPVGAHCIIRTRTGRTLPAEVIAVRGGSSVLAPYGKGGGPPAFGIQPGDEVEWRGGLEEVPVGWGLLGRVVDAFLRPIDGKGPILAEDTAPLYRSSPHPLARPRISEAVETGVRALDGLFTVGKGQRMGVFSGTGVGKSIFLGMIARHASAPVRVVALVGERGREVREFIERELGEEGLRHSVVVVATGDEPAPVRVRAGFAAMAAAEFFREEGIDVVFLMDSLTRIAYAQREIGLASGEPPTTRGYTPSVFNMLPRLLERAGTSPSGSITGFFAVLVEQDDLGEPVSDAARSVLDGHLWLARELAAEGVYPAVDVIESISRVMPDVVGGEHEEAALFFRRLWASYQQIRDMIDIGAYVAGSRPMPDAAVEHIERMRDFLKQGVTERVEFEQTYQELASIRASAQDTLARFQEQVERSASRGDSARTAGVRQT